MSLHHPLLIGLEAQPPYVFLHFYPVRHSLLLPPCVLFFYKALSLPEVFAVRLLYARKLALLRTPSRLALFFFVIASADALPRCKFAVAGRRETRWTTKNPSSQSLFNVLLPRTRRQMTHFTVVALLLWELHIYIWHRRVDSFPKAFRAFESAPRPKLGTTCAIAVIRAATVNDAELDSQCSPD